jgi:hypothetical protein
MAVNRYQPHLVVYLEDRPYREIMNGVKNLPGINANVLDVRPPAGGWPKVFETLAENIKLLDANPQMHALLLMDFDNDYAKRFQRLEDTLIGHTCAERVFMLGIDDKESEDLKKSLNRSNNEAVAGILLEDCPEKTGKVWQNSHLQCNLDELQRMREKGVLEWLFQTCP